MITTDRKTAPWDLTGRTALITGASSGIGQGIAIHLAGAGCDIIVNFLDDPAGAEKTVSHIEAMGRSAIAVQGDVSQSAQVDELVRRSVERFANLDILVNNAGIQTWSSLLDLSEADWDRVIATNLKGCFLCTQAVARHMKERGGSIINIGSGCNKLPFPKLVDYTASKGGIEALTKVSAIELGQYQIRVNCVAPGAIEIERTKLELGDYQGTWGRLTPLGRIGTPFDVANAALFFASDASLFVTGQTLWVDGGLYTRPAWPENRGI